MTFQRIKTVIHLKGARVAAVLLGASALTACGSAQDGNDFPDSDPTASSEAPFTNGDTGEALVPLARFDFANGSMVNFFEIEEGDVVYVISGPGMGEVPGRELRGLQLSATQLYERLTKQPAPQALIDSDARARILAEERGNSRPPPSTRDEEISVEPRMAASQQAQRAEGVAKSQQAFRYWDCSNQTDHDMWFNCNFCAPNNDLTDWDLTRMWRTGGFSYSKQDINRARDTIWLYYGDSIHHRVRWRTWYDWSYPINENIPNWDYREWGRVNWSTDFDISVVTSDAAGDEYHHCAYGI